MVLGVVTRHIATDPKPPVERPLAERPARPQGWALQLHEEPQPPTKMKQGFSLRAMHSSGCVPETTDCTRQVLEPLQTKHWRHEHR